MSSSPAQRASAYPLLAELMAKRQATIYRRADPAGRCLLLALLFGLHRHAERRGSCSDQHDRTAELYAKPILGIQESDVVFSAAKLFFAYGLGNALSFPLVRGRDHGFAKRPADTGGGLPYSARIPADDLLWRADALQRASGELPNCRNARSSNSAPLHVGRRSVAAGSRPALARTYRRRYSRRPRLHRNAAYLFFQQTRRRSLRHVRETGVRVMKSAWSTKTATRSPKARSASSKSPVRPARRSTGTTAKRAATLFSARGPGAATNTPKAKTVILPIAGRGDDMLKVSGIWVSPFEVESALASHAAVLEAAVVGQADENGLIKPKAFVVLRPDLPQTPSSPPALQQHVKAPACALQLSALDRIRRRAAQDRHRQNPTF